MQVRVGNEIAVCVSAQVVHGRSGNSLLARELTLQQATHCDSQSQPAGCRFNHRYSGRVVSSQPQRLGEPAVRF